MAPKMLPRHMALALLSVLLAVYTLARQPFSFWPLHHAAAPLQPDALLPQPQPYGPYSDYCPLAKYEPAAGCVVDQVNIIQRHGARYPTSGAGERIKEALAKLRAVKKEALDACFDFLRDYSYALGEDDLLPKGKKQAYDAGQQIVERYPHLVSRPRRPPFVRASSSQRVVESSHHWIKGFQDASDRILDDPLIIVDDPHSNDTLSNHACARYDFEPLHSALRVWANNAGAAAAARLNKRAPGSQSTPFDFVALASLCPMENVASGTKKEAESPWCEVFDEEDWKAFEGFFDVQKYFFTGPGHPLGAVQGVGYITEVLSRLTGQLVPDDTQTNHTLNSSPSTFPLDRPVYADFSHDNQQMAIFAAMGLLDATVVHPAHPAQDPKDWLASCMVPFASRMVVERLECEGDPQPWVRVLVNERVHRMQTLSDFVASQAYATGEGQQRWLQCQHHPRDLVGPQAIQQIPL